MPTERAAIVVVNARSRKSRRAYDRALGLLRENGVRVLAEYAIADPASLQVTLRRALEEHDCPLVVAGGGDGTVSEVVDCLAGSDRILGLLPLGTSNNFARTLGLPLDLEAAVAVIAAGHATKVDLGRVDDDYFANVASLGLTVRIAASVPSWGKRYFGRVAYVLTAITAMTTQSPFDLTMSVDGVTQRFACQQLVIANGRFHAGRPITSQASIDDRRLDIQAIATSSRWRLAQSLLSYGLGRTGQLPNARVLTGQEVLLFCTPPQPIEIDGEVKATTPVRISVVPETLRVMVSGSFADR